MKIIRRRHIVVCFMWTCLLSLVYIFISWGTEAIFSKSSRDEMMRLKIVYPLQFNTSRFIRPWNCSNCFQWKYQVLLNETDICDNPHTNQTIHTIFLIPSSHGNQAQRSAIRKTWGSVTRNNTSMFRHVFFVGSTNDVMRMHAVKEESRHFRDVVVFGFQDTYRNLTIKTLHVLRWVKENCYSARFFMKVDDDMWVNVKALTDKLSSLETRLKTATGGYCQMSHRIIRDPSNKWAASYKEYPADQYPNYCSGTAYVGSTSLAASVIEISKNIPFFFMEDVFVGLCLKQLGFTNQTVKGFHLGFPKAIQKNVCSVWKPGVVTLHRIPPKTLFRFWNLMCGQETKKILLSWV